MKISTFKSEAMVLSRERVEFPLWVGKESLPQAEEFEYISSCTPVREKTIKDQGSVHSDAVILLDCGGEERNESQGKALHLLLHPTLSLVMTCG